MESTGEEESVTLCSKIDIKEEPILTDQQPEIEQIYVKEETAKLEIPEDHDGTDPLQVNKDECVLDGETTVTPDASLIKQDPECMLEEETTSTPDELPIKQESEVQIEQESTSCGSEPESIFLTGVEDNSNDDLLTGTGGIKQCTTSEGATCGQSRATKYLILSCTICEKRFASLPELKAHGHMDSFEYLHSCGVCHKTFTSGLGLQVHMMSVHTDVGSRSCERCQKSFSTGSALKKHLLLHADDRPYTCEVCRRTFKSNGNLKRHLACAHKGKRFYTCEVCQKTFMFRKQLSKHSVECSSFRRSTHPKRYPSSRGRTH